MKHRNRRLLSILLSLVLVLGMMPGMSLTAYAEGTASEYTFGYCYDCQRSPAYPKKNDTCTVSGFTYPLIGYQTRGTTSSGNWKLTYLGLYKDNSSLKTGSSTQLPSIANYVKGAYSLSSTDNIPIYELKNGSDHIAYGVLCALTSGNAQALFIGDTWRGGAGYLFSITSISSSSLSIVITQDISESMISTTYTVTYKVVNGTWSDDDKTDKTETVQSGSKPASVPTGMKASKGYTGGAWNTNPADATITEATAFTYTFTAKANQTAPTGLTATKVSSSTATDGKINGMTDAMEFQKDGDTA